MFTSTSGITIVNLPTPTLKTSFVLNSSLSPFLLNLSSSSPNNYISLFSTYCILNFINSSTFYHKKQDQTIQPCSFINKTQHQTVKLVLSCIISYLSARVRTHFTVETVRFPAHATAKKVSFIKHYLVVP